MFNIEEWQGDHWAVVRRDVPEEERDELLAANEASGNTYSDTDPNPPPATGSVYRFVGSAP